LICSLKDVSKIDRILKDDYVWPFITDDGCPEKKMFTSKPIIEDKRSIVLMPNEFTAILMVPLNFITFDFHLAVLKPGRGQMAVDTVKKTIKEYIFVKTPCRKIIMQVPNFNISMIRFAKVLGAQLEGVLKDSFLKDEKLYNQQIFSISKEA
jgi:hypothetical protein